LVSHYKREQIIEKIEFLEYLQEANINSVKSPAGWLRRAIEEDYSRPDGFLSQTERETQAKESERRRQQDAQDEAMCIIQEAAKRAQDEKKRIAHLEAIKRHYCTTEREEQVWSKIVSYLIATGPLLTKTYLTGSHLVSLSDQHAVIWFPQQFAQRYIHHRFSFTIQRLLAKNLKIGIDAITLTFVSPDQEWRRKIKRRGQV
jgi:hypothetical protein